MEHRKVNAVLIFELRTSVFCKAHNFIVLSNPVKFGFSHIKSEKVITEYCFTVEIRDLTFEVMTQIMRVTHLYIWQLH